MRRTARRRTLLLSLTLAVTAYSCGSGSASPTGASGATPEGLAATSEPNPEPSPAETSTLAPATTATIMTTPTTTTTTTITHSVASIPATPPPASATPRNLVLRYDGADLSGTLEAVVCNPTTEAGRGFGLTMTGPNGIENTVTATHAGVPGNSCASVFDSALGLPAFGITEPGRYELVVGIIQGGEAGGVVLEVAVRDVALPDPNDAYAAGSDPFTSFDDCLAWAYDGGCENFEYHTPEPEEVLKRIGDYIAIAPVELESLATFTLLEMQLCGPRIEEYLGITGPRPVYQRTFIGADISPFALAIPPVDWHIMLSFETLLGEVAKLDDFKWPTLLDGRCDPTVAHELTHLAIGSTPLPSFLNEGLATWMETFERSNGFRDSNVVDCASDSWSATWNDTWVPFSDVLHPDPNAPFLDLYYTSMCFWDYLESEYGTDTVLAIIQETVEHRDPAWSGVCPRAIDSFVYFIPDIVNPILGVDISSITQERWDSEGSSTSARSDRNVELSVRSVERKRPVLRGPSSTLQPSVSLWFLWSRGGDLNPRPAHYESEHAHPERCRDVPLRTLPSGWTRVLAKAHTGRC